MPTNAGGPAVHNQFAKAPGAPVPRSTFDRSHGLKTGINPDYLYPIMCDELLPGDTVNVRENLVGRLTTLLFPVLHPIHVSTFYFAVPVRLLWENWEKFHGSRTGPSDTDVQADFSVPTVTVPAGGYSSLSIFDYMDIVPDVDHDRINALFFRAYNFIYDEWFRDQDLIDEVGFPVDDGPDPHAGYALLKRAKRKDYFTSARPWPQKGDAVQLPLGTSAPVVPIGTDDPTFRTASSAGPASLQYSASLGITSSTALTNTENLYWVDPSLEVDLTAATAATINDLREAFQIQRVYERDARSGTRHVEHLKAHWGVFPPDYRLQRPEFLSGHRHTITVNPVAQMSQPYSASDFYVGELSATGTAIGAGANGFVYSADEHMVIIGLACLHADTVYQQGLHKKHFRGTDRFDYPLPALMHLGEQAVEVREVYADAADQDATFGYQERWAEYRYAESRVTGILRSNVSNSLDVWHLAQDFAAEPSLNQSFIESELETPLNRVLAIPTEGDYTVAPAMKVDIWWNYKHTRAMPVFSVPGLIDHL